MSAKAHEHARKLLTASRVEGISAGEQFWLNEHLAACADCSQEEDALNAAVDSLRALQVSVRPDAVLRASLAVHRRAEQLDADREHAGPLCVAAAVSALSLIFTTPASWLTFAWLGRLFQVSEVVWQLGFFMWWFLPTTVLGAVAAWQHVSQHKEVRTDFNQINWEQR